VLTCTYRGAFFFVRSLLSFVEGKAPFGDAEWKGYVLMICFFLDAWILGECLRAAPHPLSVLQLQLG
jgi:hypothetical protein